MTASGQAGGEKTEPVLMLYASTGFPFGLDADGTVQLREMTDLSAPLDCDADPVGFASPDAAVAYSMTPGATRSEPQGTALVIVDDWKGHDFALQNFSLLFVRHRLHAAGFRHVRFLVTQAEEPPGGWRSELDVVHGRIPMPVQNPAPPRFGAAPSLMLLVDRATASKEIIDWAERLQRDRAVTVHALIGNDSAVDLTLPVTFNIVAEPAKAWSWLVSRAYLVAGVGLAGWQRRYVALAEQSGLPVVDVATREGRARAIQLLEADAATRRTSLADTRPVALADWLRRLAGRREAAA